MSCWFGKIPPLSVRLDQLSDEFSSIYIYWVYVLEDELPPFSLSLIFVIQWRTKPVVVTKRIGSSVNFNSEYHFQVAPSRPDTCWHF